ncbi:MAG TPA: response regulator transcription factor [Chitinophagaceae bacterium]|nr:response regulator transcription factor [Chitinophagaceae bacterium]
MHILIADDHSIVYRGIKQLLLEEYPFAIIEEASDAEELIQKAISGKWDVVISDINMPGRSGIDALQEIKMAVPDLPVLIMSMYPEEQYAIRALKAGASGYLGKETIHYYLIRAVEKILSGKKFITPSIAEKLADSLGEESGKEPHESLSSREFEVFILLASGSPNSAIAGKLSLNTTTVSTYRFRIMEKMKMKSNAELSRYALEKKLI